MAVVIGLLGIALAVALLQLVDERERRIQASERFAAASEQLETLRQALSVSEEHCAEARREAKDTNSMLYAVREQKQREFRVRENALLAQIQAMAERLATLKMKWVGPDAAAGGEFALAEDVVVGADLTRLDEPYSSGLSDFMSALDSEDAREMVESYVEARRAEGLIDEQILDKLERGEY